jgi:hypothetical protein
MGPTALLPLRRKCALRIFIAHKNPPPSVGLEPATEYPVGAVASTLTTRPPRATKITDLRAEIWTRYLPDSNQECQPLCSDFGSPYWFIRTSVTHVNKHTHCGNISSHSGWQGDKVVKQVQGHAWNDFWLRKQLTVAVHEISGSQGHEYKDSLLGCCIVQSGRYCPTFQGEDGGNKLFWNVDQYLTDDTVYSQSSSIEQETA